MLLLIDNYDSFTYNLVDYFEQLGQDCFVVKNDVPPSDLPSLSFDGVILSPGPGKPTNSGFLMEYLAYFVNRLPILGVCLGHQAIAKHFGAEVVKAIKPMHGKVSEVIKVEEDELVKGLPQKWDVVRYHSLVVSFNSEVLLKKLAVTKDNEIMMLKHQSLPIYGIQFHPEAVLTQYGLEVLGNWLQIVQNRKIGSCVDRLV